ncbi:MAG: 30S ribosomal protein S3 [Candidatus Omnitrophica bacterium]|nr:30S ribosomal protein S3 [Candidatus Omnitrophota bacterium]
MGQKVHPLGLRIGINKTWHSRWISKNKKEFSELLHEDLKIKNFIKQNLSQAGVSRVEIERASEKLRVIINTARPGIIIGRKGQDIDRLREDIQNITEREVYIDIKEIKNPALDAQLVSENIAFQLERRVVFRRAMKKAVSNTIDAGAGGIKVICAGRLGGAEMSRQESYKVGKVPLHTLRADIDYGFAQALTTYGYIGVKVWIYKGEVLPTAKTKEKESETKKADT